MVGMFVIVFFLVVTAYYYSEGGYRHFGGTNRCPFSLDHVTIQRTTTWVFQSFQESLFTGCMIGESGSVGILSFIYSVQISCEAYPPSQIMDIGTSSRNVRLGAHLDLVMKNTLSCTC